MFSKYGIMWVNGNFIDNNEALIPVMTHGLHYASAVFEGIRVYKGRVFMLKEHVARLRHSAELFDMNIKISNIDIENAIIKIVKMNNISDGYIRPVVFRGGEEIKIAALNSSIHIAIAAWSTNNIDVPKDLSKGYKLTVGYLRRAPSECIPVSSKCSASYAISTIEKHKAIKAGYDDALLLDIYDNIAETTSSNIFFVKDNELYTPIPDCFLNGLTRQKIIEIASTLGIKVNETKIKLSEIDSFSDAFVTSTTLDIMPINYIKNVEYHRHNITERLYKFFYENYISA